jgi:DNA-binding winged helix-turn-helix (wHTH) protein
MQQFGDFRIDQQNECLWRGDEMLSLTPRPFAVLRYLIENPQRLITHDELLEALWPETYVQPQVLRTYILELRKLLGDDPAYPRYIQTIPKRGYRFLFAVSESVKTESTSATSALVGRESEQSFLAEHLKRVKKAERSTIFITGEPGIGKTTLLDAFCAAHCNDEGLRIARGQSIEGFGGKESFYPVREALNNLCSADDGKARAMLASIAPNWAGRNGSTSLGELCEAFESLAAQHPLVLIFEDIHWADTSTLDLISALARRRSRAKLMLLASYRPSDIDTEHPLRTLEQDLLTNSRSEELRLGPLNKQAVSEYLRRELRSEKLPSGLSSLIHQHSAGNPLFMTAVLEHLRGQNMFRMDDGQLHLRVPLSEIELGVPEGLAGIIEFQLEKLSDEDRRLLEAGSIAGSIFPAWAAAAALELTIDEVEEAYAALVRRVRLLAIAGQDELPDGTQSAFYVFSHALYREVLYTRMPAARRAQWHRRVAERLRAMFAENESSVAYEIAAHAEAGGVTTR